MARQGNAEYGGALPRSKGRSGRRGLVLAAIAAAGLWAAFALELDPRDLLPGDGGLAIAGELFSRALSPALTYEADDLPAGIQPLPLKALEAARLTVTFAAAALSLSVVFGLLLGFLASTAWWAGEPAGGAGVQKSLRRTIRPLLYGSARVVIALLRSIHELIWAVLLLAAFGLSQLTAVIAIAIPYSGTLAKVFSEMLDEAPRDAARALRAAGASPAQVFLFGLLPRALPDMTAYAFYRFECALRSSAVLGFFGYPTLGFYIAASFENLYYGEVWTYLYTLIGLVALADWWSGALRRRLVVA
ncbi:MAG: ABC transporter permease subunit [Acidobacteriota bacterium]